MRLVTFSSLMLLVVVAGSSPSPPPLRAPVLQRLRVGATKRSGWLLDELSLQGKGLSGGLPFFWSYFNRSSWVNHGSGSTQPQQFIPYYLNGLVPLSFQIADARVVAIRDRYLQYILQDQEAKPLKDGGRWLGPDIPRGNQGPVARNYWSKYLAVNGFYQYAEAVQDSDPKEHSRVLTALVQHHRAFYNQLRDADPPLNVSRWGFARYEDGIDGIQWLLDPRPSTGGPRGLRRHGLPLGPASMAPKGE